MRGKADSYAAWQSSKRITPAYAGKSQSTPRRIRCQGDHPRLCGEKKVLTEDSVIQVGSPPPMRGKAILRRFKF